MLSCGAGQISGMSMAVSVIVRLVHARHVTWHAHRLYNEATEAFLMSAVQISERSFVISVDSDFPDKYKENEAALGDTTTAKAMGVVAYLWCVAMCALPDRRR